MPQIRIPAVFMRGGTSNALVFKREDLPEDDAAWPALFLAAMGSPDPNGRQLNGMGGGISSLSKICVIGPPTRKDADIDYSFFQIGVTDETVDTSGNCGNMSSAMGPFAIDEGLVPAPPEGGKARVSGDFALDGVSGTGAPIRLEFLDPGGAGTGRLLPTGQSLDILEVPGLGPVEASMVDAANPCVSVAAESIGRTGTELPDALEADAECLAILEKIRRAASLAMGIADTEDEAGRIPSIPKVAMIFAPTDCSTLSGARQSAADYEIGIRMISIGRPHRAVPLTGGICLAVATRIPGSLPNRLARPSEAEIRVGHPSGTLSLDADVTVSPDGTIHAKHGAVYRTARRMFEGHVLVPA